MKAGQYAEAEPAFHAALDEARASHVSDETKFSTALAACLLEEGKKDPEKLREVLPVLQKIHEQKPDDASIINAIKKTEDELSKIKSYVPSR